MKGVTELSLQHFFKSICQMEAALKWHFGFFFFLTGIYRPSSWLKEVPRLYTTVNEAWENNDAFIYS